MAGRGERFSVPVGDKLVYYGTWDHDPSKYANFRTMFETARSQLTEFEATKARIEADENLSAKGTAQALNQAVREFEALHRRFKAGPVMDRKPALLQELAALRGGRPREKDDSTGELRDREMRDWFRSLKGDERTSTIGALTRGEMPEVTSALLRMPDQMTGLRPDLREKLEAVAVEPHNADEVNELRTELGAIEQAEQAMERTESEIFGLARDSAAVADLEAAAALEDEGLQKAKDGKTDEPFVAPEVQPFEKDGEGVIDLKATRARDLAKKTGAA